MRTFMSIGCGIVFGLVIGSLIGYNLRPIIDKVATEKNEPVKDLDGSFIFDRDIAAVAAKVKGAREKVKWEDLTDTAKKRILAEIAK